MKKAKVIYTHIGKDAVCEGFILEGVEDLKKLKRKLGVAENRVITKFVKSGESPSRFSHIIYGMRPLEKALATLANVRALTFDNNPIYNLEYAGNIFINTALKMIMRNGSVFVNDSGGMTPMDTLEIIESEEIEDFNQEEPQFYIRQNSKVINLENDCYLEKNARDYMRKRFSDNYSYITELIVLTENQLERIFRQFKDQGGEYVYVYTTGMNIQQMYDYSKVALKVGLDKFIFDFHTGTNEDINTFITTLKSKAKVELL